MSRDHRSLHSATTLLRQHGITITPGGRRRLVKPRMPRTNVAMPPVQAAIVGTSALVAELRMLGARVDKVQRDIDGPCERCQLEGHEANTEVYIGRDEHDAMCQVCALAAVKAADRPVVVEVLVP